MGQDDESKRRSAWSEAFAHVIGQTTLPPEIAEELTRGFWPGDSPRREMQILRQILLRREWRWPLFDEWAARFAADGAWPGMWTSYGEYHAEDNDDGMLDERIEILHHTLNFTANTFAKFAQYLDWYGADPTPRYVLDISSIGDGPGRIEGKIAKPFRAAINAGDHSRLPPFFPGDRTSLGTKKR